ncbi:MAG: lecithin--cholesterol acyltransferase [Xenococcus sp. (in: cyanobacteria)]
MPKKTPLKDIVVILPGITGSVLQKDGQDVWGASKKALSEIIFTGGDVLQQLKLDREDALQDAVRENKPIQGAKAEDYEYGDGIRAVRIVNDARILAGLIKILDGYSKTSELITEKFDVENSKMAKNFEVIEGDIYNDGHKPANFYHFPYDWRRDNRINAKILNSLINKRLKAWREHSGNQDAKVILMAHSMGGLISRYHLEVLGGWQDCKALFTFGTPYRGSVNAVNSLANGLKKGFVDLSEVMRSLPSVYQLLPIYSMLQVGDENKRIAEVADLPHINQDMAQDALAFHREIESAVENNSKDSKYHEQFATVPFVGVQQPTLQSAELKNGEIEVSRDLPRIMQGKNLDHLADGDGTVPQISAFPIEFSDGEVLEIVSFVAEKHGALQNQEDILLSLLKKFQLAETIGNIEDIRGRGDEKARSIQVATGISLDLDDSYYQDEAITIKAQVNGDPSFDSLKATIECLSDTKAALNLDFEPDGKGFVIKPENIELGSGLYRITVQTDNIAENAPSAVHDLFAVT